MFTFLNQNFKVPIQILYCESSFQFFSKQKFYNSESSFHLISSQDFAIMS